VDANIILRYLLKDGGELAEKARMIWDAVEAGRLLAVCDPVTLGEAVFVMSSVYHVPNEKIAGLLVSLLEPGSVLMVARAATSARCACSRTRSATSATPARVLARSRNATDGCTRSTGSCLQWEASSGARNWGSELAATVYATTTGG